MTNKPASSAGVTNDYMDVLVKDIEIGLRATFANMLIPRRFHIRTESMEYVRVSGS